MHAELSYFKIWDLTKFKKIDLTTIKRIIEKVDFDKNHVQKKKTKNKKIKGELQIASFGLT